MDFNGSLFRAILAMDSYDRGYARKLKVDGDQLGNVNVARNSEILGPGVDENASFFAQSYTLGSTTFISYRGTDAFQDVLQWTIWFQQNYNAQQAYMATDFYRLIASLADGPIVTTGHSLGGALAGFVAARYGLEATTFDHIDYRGAANKLYVAATTGVSVEGAPQIDFAAKAYYYGTATPTPPDFSRISSIALEGEVAGRTRTDNSSVVTKGIGDDIPLSGADLHSQALLVLAIYGQALSDQSWLSAGKFLAPALLDDKNASPLGFVKAANGGGTGTGDMADQMLRAIAYSAIDEGYRPFGDKAIVALFNDANDLGKLVKTDGIAEYLKSPTVLKSISGFVAEYAGLLAVNKTVSSASTEANTGFEKGAINYDKDHDRLIADFSRDLWKITAGDKSGEQADIVGKKTLTDEVLRAGGETLSSIDRAFQTIWNDKTDHLVKLVAQTKDQDGVTLDAVADAQIGDGDNAKPSDGALLVGGGGSNTLNGASGYDLLIGGGGVDTFDGRGGNDVMFGGAGNDVFTLGDAGTHWIDGGADKDSANYSKSDHTREVTLGSGNGASPAGDRIVNVSDATTGQVDYLVSVETIDLGGGNHNTVTVKSLPPGSGPSNITFNLGATTLDNNATVDFSQYGARVNLGHARDGTNATALYRDTSFLIETGFQFQRFNTLYLSPKDDKAALLAVDNPYLTQVYTLGGKDSIWSDVYNLKIDVAPNRGDVGQVEHAAQGSIITIGEGQGRIFTSDDVLVVGAKHTDVIASATGTILHGAVGRVGSESVWITGPDGTEYSINFEGFLAIKDKSGAIMYIDDYKGGPSVPFDEQTAKIFVGKSQVTVAKLLDLDRPFNDTIKGTFQVGAAKLYAKSGIKFFDPLVLDLNGDGVHLVRESAVSPMFDMNNTGFGIHTGWVQPDDGLLVHDKNHNGQIDAAREMFGGPGAQGFDALASYDLNSDGVIGANDPVYNELQVWRDLNGNAHVDAGELQTLTQAGIAVAARSSSAHHRQMSHPETAGYGTH